MRIYCDANASTPIDPRVMERYLFALKSGWANPSSSHREGQKARALLNEARERCAALFRVLPRQVIFYSSATEALNTLIPSLFRKNTLPLLVSNIDHAALLEPSLSLKEVNVPVDVVPIGDDGVFPISELEKREGKVGGIATFIANNETGIVNDIEALSAYARAHSIPLLLDGVAALGKMEFIWLEGMTACCFASHKVYSPKGVGMAIVDKNVLVEPLLLGGGQESGRRAGTENVPAIYAFSYALQLLIEEQQGTISALSHVRDYFEQQLTHMLFGIQVHSGPKRVSNVSNLYIEGVSAEELLMCLDQEGVAISVGSACSAGALEPSKVICAMYNKAHALSSVRFSFCKGTTIEEIDRLLKILKQVVTELR